MAAKRETAEQKALRLAEYVGRRVRITVQPRVQNRYPQNEQTYTGLVLALGQKTGVCDWDRPWCLVINTGNPRRVVIASIRTIAKIETI